MIQCFKSYHIKCRYVITLQPFIKTHQSRFTQLSFPLHPLLQTSWPAVASEKATSIILCWVMRFQIHDYSLYSCIQRSKWITLWRLLAMLLWMLLWMENICSLTIMNGVFLLLYAYSKLYHVLNTRQNHEKTSQQNYAIFQSIVTSDLGKSWQTIKRMHNHALDGRTRRRYRSCRNTRSLGVYKHSSFCMEVRDNGYQLKIQS